jgi:hypothetical protein
MTPLEPGTVIEFDTFTAVVVGEDMLLVFESSSSFVREGGIVRVVSRGDNDWVVSLSDDDSWSSVEYWIKRDWNDNVSARDFDEWDFCTWPDEWDDDLDEYLQAYEEYDY